MTDTRYEARGVSSSKADVRQAIAQLDKGLYPGAFCQIFPLEDNAYAVPHLDGAGTKAGLAYLAYKYGFPISIFKGIAQDSIVMNLDDIACVGAVTGPIFVTQLINRNKFLVPAAIVSTLVEGCKDFCAKMNSLGLNLIYAGGETADVPDLVRTLTVDNSMFARLPRVDLVDASRIEEGDVIVGFSSTGRAVWESEPNSGIGSNGLTNARHDTLSNDYAGDAETYAPEVPESRVYCGKYQLEDPLPGDHRFTVASALLSPTRTYAPLIKHLLERKRPMMGWNYLHALIHCSGGGQTKIGKFGPEGVMYHKYDLFPTPPLFAMLQSASDLPWKEMYSTYNMGHRLEAVVPQENAGTCLDVARQCGISAKVIGKVVPRTGQTRVRIESQYGTFDYQ